MTKVTIDPVTEGQLRDMIVVLRDRRRQLGLTQADVGKLMGTTGQCVSEIENRRPDALTLKRLTTYARAVRADVTFGVVLRDELWRLDDRQEHTSV